MHGYHVLTVSCVQEYRRGGPPPPNIPYVELYSGLNVAGIEERRVIDPLLGSHSLIEHLPDCCVKETAPG